MPLFVIDLPSSSDSLWIYYRKNFCDYTPKLSNSQKERELESKEQVIKKVREALGLKESNQ